MSVANTVINSTATANVVHVVSVSASPSIQVTQNVIAATALTSAVTAPLQVVGARGEKGEKGDAGELTAGVLDLGTFN